MNLFELDRQTQKRILVAGDALRDEYVHGTVEPCQDGCFKFTETLRAIVPGGAANAARSLENWNCKVSLAAVVGTPSGPNLPYLECRFNQAFCLREGNIPVKRRFIGPDGRMLWRHDRLQETVISAEHLAHARSSVLTALKRSEFDAVLLSDYDKGFLTEQFIDDIVSFCRYAKIPVVADAKRKPSTYKGAILKCNNEYTANHGMLGVEKAIQTNGPKNPHYIIESVWSDCFITTRKEVRCINHVGAGDAFAAHLVLGLAHGLTLWEAADIAHSAGRVYVQREHNCPPWPHLIQRDLDPVGGKVIATLPRRSTSGRIVFTNGVFRLITAGHASMLTWAKQQGDVLVVGVNDDESVKRVRPDQFYLPLGERVAMLAAMSAVDWIIPFSETDPKRLIAELQPDCLVKGREYSEMDIPGAALVPDVRFAPMVGDLHVTKLLKELNR